MARAARQLQLAGVFASAVTPHRKGTTEADVSASLDLLDFLADGGVSGIALLDAAGEFFNFPYSERQRLVYLGAKRSRVPLMAGVSHSTLSGSLELAEEAISSGADGLLIMPPYFFPYQQSDVEEFFVQFARETGDAVPIVLVNTPQFTSAIEPATIKRLMDTGLFAGVSDSSGNWDYFAQLAAMKKSRPFVLLYGGDRSAERALNAGADAWISSSACAIPEVAVAIEKAMRAGKMEKLQHMSSRLEEFLDWTEQFPFPVGIKQAVELRGQKTSSPAVPLNAEKSAALKAFAAWFKAWFPAVKGEALSA